MLRKLLYRGALHLHLDTDSSCSRPKLRLHGLNSEGSGANCQRAPGSATLLSRPTVCCPGLYDGRNITTNLEYLTRFRKGPLSDSHPEHPSPLLYRRDDLTVPSALVNTRPDSRCRGVGQQHTTDNVSARAGFREIKDRVDFDVGVFRSCGRC